MGVKLGIKVNKAILAGQDVEKIKRKNDFDQAFYNFFKNDEGKIDLYGNRHKLQDLDKYPKGLDLENFEIVDMGGDYATFEAGGDWQQMVRFTVGEKDGKLIIAGLYDGGDFHINRQTTNKRLKGIEEKYREVKKALIGLARRKEKLEYFRKRIMDHLEKLEKEDMGGIKKSILQVESMQKGGVPTGTRHTWKDGTIHVKTPSGKWKRVYDGHSRGAKMAISAIKKRIAAAKDEREMMNIIMDNRDRFSDKEGHPLPFVQELSDFVRGEGDARESTREKQKTKEWGTWITNPKSRLNAKLHAGKTEKEQYRKEAAELGIDNDAIEETIAEVETKQKGATEKPKKGPEGIDLTDPAEINEKNYRKIRERQRIAYRDGDKKEYAELSSIIGHYFSDFKKKDDEARKKIIADRNEKAAAEAKKRTDEAAIEREKETAKQRPPRGTRSEHTTFTERGPGDKRAYKFAGGPDGEDDDKSSEANDFEAIQKKYQSAKSETGDADEIQAGKELLSGVWKLVEADTPTASHNETTFHKTPGFPTNEDGSTINDRDYGHDKAAQEAVMSIGVEFDGRALKVDNPVIVTKDGIVISGNNRTMSSKIAARKGTDKSYIDALKRKAKKFGFTVEQVEQFKNPRVVFEVENKSGYSTEQFAKFNQSTKKEMGPTERAVKVSKLIKTETVEAIAGKIGEFDTLGELYADRGSVQSIFGYFKDAGLIGENETGKYIEEGAITEDGKTFIETAFLGSVMNEANIRGFNCPGCKSIRATLVRAITPLIENKGMDGYSINRELNEAVDIAMQVAINRDKFRTVDEFSKQGSMFESLDTVAVELAKKLEGTQKSFAEFMQTMNGGLKYAANGEADIFLGGVEGKDDILSRFLNIKKSVAAVLQSIPMPHLIKSFMNLWEDEAV
jgi:hypothetical protein